MRTDRATKLVLRELALTRFTVCCVGAVAMGSWSGMFAWGVPATMALVDYVRNLRDLDKETA